MDQSGEGKKGATQGRWLRGMADRAFDRIRELKLIETKAEDLLAVLKAGTVSTNIFLRRLHNYDLDMNWLMAPVIPRRQWRPIKFQEKRAITLEEHQKIIAGERNEVLRGYYEMLWHLGGSQSDVAALRAEDIKWKTRTISYARMKAGSNVLIRFGESVARIVQCRPKKGLLFPQIAAWKESDRAKAFSRRRKLVGVYGVSLHSYRYAWAERALAAGYPERYAQQALGHRSRAVHSAHARKANVHIPALEDFESATVAKNVISLPLPALAVPVVTDSEVSGKI
jgi:integrase